MYLDPYLKGRHINSGIIKIIIDNDKVYRMINGDIDVPSKYTQDAAVVVAQIIELVGKIKFTVEFYLERGKPKIN